MISVHSSRVSPVGIVLMLPDGRWQDWHSMVKNRRICWFYGDDHVIQTIPCAWSATFFYDSHEGETGRPSAWQELSMPKLDLRFPSAESLKMCSTQLFTKAGHGSSADQREPLGIWGGPITSWPVVKAQKGHPLDIQFYDVWHVLTCFEVNFQIFNSEFSRLRSGAIVLTTRAKMGVTLISFINHPAIGVPPFQQHWTGLRLGQASRAAHQPPMREECTWPGLDFGWAPFGFALDIHTDLPQFMQLCIMYVY